MTQARQKNLNTIMTVVFGIAAAFSVVAVIVICIFLFVRGIPAMAKVGLFDFLFGVDWRPNNNDVFDQALEGMYGILPMIVASIYVTAGAIVVGVPIGVLCAVFLARFCPARL